MTGMEQICSIQSGLFFDADGYASLYEKYQYGIKIACN